MFNQIKSMQIPVVLLFVIFGVVYLIIEKLIEGFFGC